MSEIPYVNIILPKEFIVYESKKSFGVQYSYRKPDGTYEDCIIFIPVKFKQNRGLYEVKIGLIRTWVYRGYFKNKTWKDIQAPALISYLVDKRRRQTSADALKKDNNEY